MVERLDIDDDERIEEPESNSRASLGLDGI
jgi:hypothetical protein